MNDASPRQQIVDSIKSQSNILVTVSTSPSVDELSAALGLTILLNNLNKRATAVVSGDLPPAITFLDPKKTFESTVDSLRDFIIALDKEKADHLRYKVEGDVVKIFITPYRTTLSEKDLQFSQGDYNVELVIALGVKDKDHLDKALEAHGRILHDATVATICAGTDISSLGSIAWQDEAASSLCEMLVSLSEPLKTDKPVLDEQIATAFLTGIVSATDRFSNNKTSSRVMTMAAQLMAAGANQQLIAAKLEEAHEIGPNASSAQKNEKRANADGTTSLAEGEPTAVDKDRKKSKKPKDGFAIKHDNKQVDKPETPPVEEKQAEEAALAAAAPVAEVAEEAEQKLADELNAVTQPPAVASTESLQEELAKELETAPELPVDEISPESTLQQPANAGLPSEEPITPPSGLDFEPLPPPPPLPPEVSGQAIPAPHEQQTEPAQADINATHTNNYINGAVPPSPFQAPLNGLEQGDGEPASVDPFATPLLSSSIPTIQPDPLFEAQQLTSKAAPSLDMPPPPANVAADMPDYEESPIRNDPAAVAAVPDFEAINPTGLSSAPLPAVSPEPASSMGSDLPPLPPLPDFSTLPPLPPPPQFGPAPPADTSTPAPGPATDTLGDIFSAEQLPSAPAAAPEPTPPNQFKIPGQ